MEDLKDTTPPREEIQARLEEAIFEVLRDYAPTPEAARRSIRAMFRICGRMMHQAHQSHDEMLMLATYGYESEQAPTEVEAAEWTRPKAQA